MSLRAIKKMEEPQCGPLGWEEDSKSPRVKITHPSLLQGFLSQTPTWSQTLSKRFKMLKPQPIKTT